MKITNHNNESILYKTYEQLYQGESVRMLSRDWKSFKVPKSLLSFLSGYFVEDYDLMITPVDSHNLGNILNIISGEFTSFKGLNDQTLQAAKLLGIERSTVESVAAVRQKTADVQKRLEIEAIKNIDTHPSDDQEGDIRNETHNYEDDPEDKNDAFENKNVAKDEYDAAETLEDYKVEDDAIETLEEDKVEDDAAETIEDNEVEDDPNLEFLNRKGNRILESTGHGRREIPSRECQYCGEVFRGSRRSFTRHLCRHEIQQKDCGCGIKFTSFSVKERHMKLAHWGHLPCTLCRQTLMTPESLQNHMNNVHGSSYSCTICKFYTDSGSKLKRHMRVMHIPNILKPASELSCEECGKVFPNDIRKKIHDKKVHNPKTCSICGKTVKNIRRHLATMHQEDSEKRFLCPQCGKGFIDSSSLGHHQMNLHIRSRPYKCRYPGCSRGESGYNDMGNRNSHERRVHGATFKIQ